MRIAQVITHMEEVGGAQLHVGDLAVRLKKEGHDVWMVTGGDSFVIRPVLDEGIPVILLKSLKKNLSLPNDFIALCRLYSSLRKVRPDLIACHSSKAGMLGRIAGWLLGVPVVFTAHGWAFTEGVPANKRRLYSKLEKGAAVLSSGIISVSEYDSRLALANRIVPGRKLNTIRNGVYDIDLAYRAKPGSDPPVMMMVARFAPPKNQLDLLRSLSLIGLEDWSLVLVGDGDAKESAERLAGDLGLEGKVHFTGNQDDIPDLLRSAQVFVLISDYEGLPLSILEAMRSGLPIVASNVGGVPELVQDGCNGYLVDRGDIRDLAAKLELLLSDANLRKRMGKVSRSLYERHYTYDRMYRKTLKVYEDAAALKRGNLRKEERRKQS